MNHARPEGRDVGAKSEGDVWWTHPEDGRTKQVLRPEMSPRRCNLTKLTLCRILGKPRSILSLLCFYEYQLKFFMFDALGCRSWTETHDAYIFLVQNIYLEPYLGPGSNICLAMLSSVEVR
jgi:hypothetical protein